jgi:hypothetical protein
MHKSLILALIFALILLIILMNINKIEGFNLSEFGSLFNSDVVSEDEDDDCTNE